MNPFTHRAVFTNGNTYGKIEYKHNDPTARRKTVGMPHQTYPSIAASVRIVFQISMLNLVQRFFRANLMDALVQSQSTS
jgi:hypothetical protein